MRSPLLLLLAGGVFATAAVAEDTAHPPPAPGKEKGHGLAGVTVTWPPFSFTTDVGNDTKDEEATAQKFLRPMMDTANFFLAVYRLKASCFADYATYWDRPSQHYEPNIRIHLWRTYDDFLADYQKRYQTKSIPGAFFGINAVYDDYGNPTSTWVREVGTSTEGQDDQAVLREFYHEMGHLFMRTYMLYAVEVPSWIEEGTAELFQYRVGNGTHPEEEREQREGWLREMLVDGSIIPWKAMTNVHNLDNLDFTYKDPIRSQIQYVQAWSMMEFMVSNDARQDAFLDMLKLFKRQAADKTDEVSRMNLTNEQFHQIMEPYLYSIQEKTFEKCYGNQLTEVEGAWRTWVQHNYDRDLPKKPQLHYYRGDWYLVRARLHKPDEDPSAWIAKASAIFEDCIVKEPKSPYGLIGRGRVLLAQNKIAEAGDAFSQALALGANNYEAMLYGGIARVLSGHCAEAIEPLSKAAAKRPTDAQVQYWLGRAMAAGGGDYKIAVNHLRLARNLDPKMGADTCYLEGAADFHAGHSQEAYIAWLTCENLEPNFPHIQLFQALAKADDSREDALALLRQLPDEPEVQLMRDALADNAKTPLPQLQFTPTGAPQLQFGPPEGTKGGTGGEAPATPAATTGGDSGGDTSSKAKSLFDPDDGQKDKDK